MLPMWFSLHRDISFLGYHRSRTKSSFFPFHEGHIKFIPIQFKQQKIKRGDGGGNCTAARYLCKHLCKLVTKHIYSPPSTERHNGSFHKRRLISWLQSVKHRSSLHSLLGKDEWIGAGVCRRMVNWWSATPGWLQKTIRWSTLSTSTFAYLNLLNFIYIVIGMVALNFIGLWRQTQNLTVRKNYGNSLCANYGTPLEVRERARLRSLCCMGMRLQKSAYQGLRTTKNVWRMQNSRAFRSKVYCLRGGRTEPFQFHYLFDEDEEILLPILWVFNRIQSS